MSDDDKDVLGLAELSRELPPIDLDAQSAERIARRAGDSVGKGPSPRRFLEPALVAVIVSVYLIWALMKVLELLG